MSGLLNCLTQCVNDVWTGCAADLLVAYTLHHHTGGAFDPASGTATTPVSTITDYGFLYDYNHQQLADQVLRPTDKALQCRLSSLGVTPNAGDWVVIGGITHDIISVKRDVANLVAECQLRRRGSSI